MLVLFDDIIAHIESNKLKSYSHWIGFKRKKTQYFTFFILQSYFKVCKTVILNQTHYFVMKIPNKRELFQTSWNFIKIILKNQIPFFSQWYKKIHYDLGRTWKKWVLVRKLRQPITKSSKTKLNMIQTDKLLRFELYHPEMLIKMNF